MPYDRESLYLTFGGPYFLTEQWQTGIHFADGLTTDLDVAGLLALNHTLIHSALSTFIAAPYAMWSDRSPISWHRFAIIKRDGTYKTDPVINEYIPNLTNAATTQLPPQVSWVASMWSGSTTGRANYGRMYMPVPATAVPSNGLLSTEVQDGARDAVYDLLVGLTAGVTASPLYAELAPAIMSKEGTGYMKEISKIGVGRVLDTQRRRRNALQESINWDNAPF